MHRTRPGKGFGKQLIHPLHLGGYVLDLVSAPVVWLIPDIPAQNAVVLGESADNASYIRLQLGLYSRIMQAGLARALHPTGIVDSRNGRVLRTELGVGFPTGVEQHQQRSDMVSGGDPKEGVEPLLEA